MVLGGSFIPGVDDDSLVLHFLCRWGHLLETTHDPYSGSTHESTPRVQGVCTFGVWSILVVSEKFGSTCFGPSSQDFL